MILFSLAFHTGAVSYTHLDLREKPSAYWTMKTQADHLPTFMKTAKNRERIVKILKNMQKEGL